MTTAHDTGGSPITQATKKAGRFSKEFVATIISLLTTAFGVVVALAWNEALSFFFEKTLHTEGSRMVALFVYAIVITTVGVLVIVVLGKLAHRINAEPVEFKYPVKLKPEE